MAKAPVIEEKQLRHMLKVAGVTGQTRVRDQALLYVLYGTGMMLTEAATIAVSDYLKADGVVRDKSAAAIGRKRDAEGPGKAGWRGADTVFQQCLTRRSERTDTNVRTQAQH